MKLSTLIIVSLVAVIGLTGCSNDATNPASPDLQDEFGPTDLRNMVNAPGDMTIAEIAEAEGFTLLLAAVNYIAETNPESELVAGLLDRSQLTVFAPTDAAFVDLVTVLDETFEDFDPNDPFASIDELLGEGTLEAVVSYHVTNGRRASNSVVPPRGERVIETLLEGATFNVTTDAEIIAVGNTADIVLPDVSASNGIIHVINAVILPVDLGLRSGPSDLGDIASAPLRNMVNAPGEMTIAEIAEAEGFTLLLAAVNYIAETNPESELVAGLLDRSQLTVFAPTDAAFVNLVTVLDQSFEDFDPDDPFASIDQLLGPGTLEAVVSYHVTNGRRASNSVVPRRGERVINTLLEGATFNVTTDAQIIAVGNTADIVLPDVSASNGIIHVINAVILPVDLGL